MKLKKLALGSLLLLLASASTQIAQGGLQQKSANNDLEAKADSYIKPYVDIKGFSGSVLIARKGKVLLSKGYGMANYELDVRNTPQTRFHIASVSKTFTAAAIMILQERGLLSVTDRLAKYISDYPNGDKITIHHLLIHTSGIVNVNGLPEYNDRSRFPQTPASLIEMFKSRPLNFQPGERYSYSNSNYNVLAYIIEKASGKSYGEFLKANIFDPLAMHDTGHDGNARAIIRNSASGYAPAGVTDLAKVPYLDWSAKTGNGSIYTTVEDMYKWDRALYAEKILKKSSLEKIFTPHGEDSIGYGWFIGTRFNRKVVRIGGRSPGFQCEIHRYVDDDVCVVVLGNNYSGAASLMIDDLDAIVFGEPYETLAVRPDLKFDSKVIDAYLGRFQGDENFLRPRAIITIERQEGNVAMRWGPDTANILLPISETKFYDRAFGAVVTFVKNEKGEVDHLLYRMSTPYRVNKLPSQ